MAMTLTGFVYDNSGSAVSGATVQGYVSADAATTTAETSTTTDSNGKWSITTSTAARIPMDVKITYGSNVRWLKAGDGINVTNLTASGVVTVGEDDVGYDVKFHGASAGAYMEWDESADQLRIMGASADATTSTGKLLLATSLTNINANDVIGKVEFQAPHEAGGTDAITVAAAIEAVAQGTFAADLNSTDIIFKTGHSEAATEKFRFTSQGELGIGGATYGSSGDVLTSGGAGAAPTWETPTTGDITAVSLTGDTGGALSVASGAAGFTLTGGAGIDTAGSSTTVTFTLDLSELTDTAIANGDYIVFTDTTDSNVTVKGDLADVATLFAGTGLSASSSVISLDFSELSAVTPTSGDSFATLDNDGAAEQRTTTDALATLFAGDGLQASSAVLSLDLVSNGGLEISSNELRVATGIAQYDVAQFAASVADNDFLRIDGTAVEGLSAAEVAAAIESNIDAVGTISTGVWQGTVVAAAYLPDASTSAQGVSELATAAEVTAGTDTGRTVTPDALAGSVVFGTRYVQCVVFDFGTDIAEGNGKFYFHVPAGMNGMDLVEVHSEVVTAGNGSTIDVQIHNATDGSDMLSTSLTIDDGETGSDTAATAAVINGSEDDVATNDVIRIDVDGNGGDTTVAKGLIVTLGFRIP